MKSGQSRKTVWPGGLISLARNIDAPCILACLLVGLTGAASQLGALAAPAPNDAPRSDSGRIDGEQEPTSRRPSEAIDRELFAPDPKPPQPTDRRAAEQRAVRPEAIVEQMLRCARRLAETDSGPGTQQLQQRIVEDLEAILRQATKDLQDATASRQKNAKKPETEAKSQTTDSGQQAPSAKPGAPSEPGQSAGSAKGPGGQAGGLADRASLLRRVWGDLPVRQRQEILRFQPPEEFLPEYQAEIEAYFRRLAEGGKENRWDATQERGE